MINLSQTIPSRPQIRLMTRGPKFCPVEKGRKTDFYGGTKLFSKKLILQERYFDAETNDPSLICPQSKKYITTKNKQLSEIISIVNKLTPNEKFTADNLDKEERKALEELKILCDSSLVLKKADKSNTLVLWTDLTTKTSLY